MPNFQQHIADFVRAAARKLQRKPPAPAGAGGVADSLPPITDRFHVGPAQFITSTFAGERGSRDYKLFVPSTSGGGARALIVMLHGCTQSADDFAAGTRMNALAEEHGFLVVYPEQSSSGNRLLCWNWYNHRDQERTSTEPAIIAGITRRIMHAYDVDPERVYVAGASAGAGAAAILGATYPEIYAAVGAHSGIAYGLANGLISAFALMKTGRGRARAVPEAQRQAPIPTIVFQGDRDPVVNPRNAERFADGPYFAACTRQHDMLAVTGGHAYARTTFTDARGVDVLEQWIVHEMGHAWSGGSSAGTYTDPHGPDASGEMVRFFLGHRLDRTPPADRDAAPVRRRWFSFRRSPQAPKA